MRVPLVGEVDRLLLRGDRPDQPGAPGLLPSMEHERVLHVLESSQERLLEADRRLLLPGILHLDVGPNPSSLKKRPRDLGPKRPESAGCRGEVRGVQALEADASRQKEAWVQIRRRDPDPGRRRGQLPLRTANVRPAAQKFRRQAYRDL